MPSHFLTLCGADDPGLWSLQPAVHMSGRSSVVTIEYIGSAHDDAELKAAARPPMAAASPS
jgi:hypothetical protein